MKEQLKQALLFFSGVVLGSTINWPVWLEDTALFLAGGLALGLATNYLVRRLRKGRAASL
jgi:hypothetical protein